MKEMNRKVFEQKDIRYLFTGGCSAAVNLAGFAVFRSSFFHMNIVAGNLAAILLSVLFAYAADRQSGFGSGHMEEEGFEEPGSFIRRRFPAIILELWGMVFMVCLWGIREMTAKLFLLAAVFALNYILDKKTDVSGRKRPKINPVKKRCCALGFAIPAAALAFAFAVNGVFPFGDRGVLIIDSLHQYLPFFTEFHEKLEQAGSLRYSFGGGLGFNFWATFAYYLASPLNLIVALFPKRNVMDVMALLIVLKTGLCGLTSAWYFSTKNKGRTYTPVVFSTMSALGSFMIGYYFNIMWLDSIAMLPIVMMGIERIVRGEKGSLYGISLFYALYCNYYIGFMLCLFSCLYFLVMWVSAKQVEIRKVFFSCLNFGWYSLLAGGMGAVVLLPAYVALGITESAENSFPQKVELFVQNFSQLTSQFAFCEPINIADDQTGVNAFCGTAVLILGILFLLDRKVRLRERIAKALLLLFLYAGFDVNVLNYIWHGFHVQNGLPNRFAFIYTFFLLTLAFDAWRHLEKLSPKRLLPAIAAPLAFAGYAAATGLGERALYTYALTLLLLGIYSLLLLLYRMGKLRKAVFRSAFLGLGMLEMISFGIYGVCCNGTVGRSTYLDEQSSYEKMIAAQHESGFFRSEIDSNRMRNENMFLGADGVVLFSSTMPAATVNLCKSLGIEARTNKNGYNGYTKLINDVFGVKYVISSRDGDSLYQMEKAAYAEPMTLYKNKEALGLGFLTDSAIRDWDTESREHFAVQNEFVTLATGEEPLFVYRETIEMEDGGSYTVILPAGKQVYLDVTTAVEKIEITTPQYEKSYETYNDHLYDLGCQNAIDYATVTCTFKEGQTGPVSAEVWMCEQKEYERVHEILAECQLVTSHAEDGHVSGSIEADRKGTLMLTIPYDEGWKVRVDGKETEIYPVGNALTGLDLSEGRHTLEMDYTPDGLWGGTVISLICIVLFLLTCAAWERMKRKEEQKRRDRTEMEIGFSEKAESFQAGIFAVLNEKKEQMQREGRKVYNLSVGTPDFEPAPHIMAAVQEAAGKPENYRYALTDRPFLLEAVQNFYKRRFGVTVEQEEIMSINGSQEGMAHIAWTLCNPGDIVLTPNPGYPIFSIGPALCGAKVVNYPLYRENGFLPVLSEIPEETAKAAKFMLVSYPLNPVCAVAPDAFYEELIAFAKKYQIIILHDNAYSDIIYGGKKGGSFLQFEGAKDVGVEFYSLSKSYNLTGARISFVIGNREIVDKFRAVRTQIDYGVFLPVQYGAAAALNGPQDTVKAQCEEYERRNQALCGGLRRIGWDVPDSEGTMFVWAPIPEKYDSSEKFVMELMERSGVICVPGSSFGSLGEGFVRFALVEPVPVMEEIVQAISESGILQDSDC